MQELIAAGKRLAAVYKKLPQIKALAFYGSVARGYVDKFSDLDIVAFCKPIPPVAKRKKILLPAISKWYSEYEIFGFVDVFDVDKITGNVTFYVDLEEIQKDLKKFKKTKRRPSENIVHYICYGTPLYDPQGFLKRAKKVFLRYPNKMRADGASLLSVVFRIARSEEIPVAIKRGNIIYAATKLERTKEALVEALYALNKKFFYPGIMKWAFRDIQQFKILPAKCLPELQRFSQLGVKEQGLKQKMAILDSLGTATLKIAKREIKGLKVRTKF